MHQAALEQRVLVMPGHEFRAEKDPDGGVAFRSTFAAAPLDDIAEGVRRLGVALRKVFRLEQRFDI